MLVGVFLVVYVFCFWSFYRKNKRVRIEVQIMAFGGGGGTEQKGREREKLFAVRIDELAIEDGQRGKCVVCAAAAVAKK